VVELSDEALEGVSAGLIGDGLLGNIVPNVTLGSILGSIVPNVALPSVAPSIVLPSLFSL
jgi:hypothetical protein